jgi:hypothetical protein
MVKDPLRRTTENLNARPAQKNRKNCARNATTAGAAA